MSFPPFIPPSMGRGAGFTPKKIASAKVWFNAGDSGSVSFSSGTNVQTWTDKISGLVATFVSGTGNVVYNAVDADHNSLPSVSIATTTTSYLSGSGWSAAGLAAASTWIALAEVKNTAVTSSGVGSVIGFSGLTIGFGNGAGPPSGGMATCTTGGYIAYTTGSYTGIAGVYEWDAGNYVAGQSRFLQNANLLTMGGTGMPNSSTWNTSGDTGVIFERGGTSGIQTGSISEIVLLCNPSMSDIYKAEGYLAWRYGRQASLPSGHVYKGAAPTSELDEAANDDQFERAASGLLVPRPRRLLAPGFRLAA